jgi:carbon storage regulator
MLVLSRKESERIRLGDSIVVTIVKIAGDRVRVGIDAPADILVLRDELEPHASGHKADVPVQSEPSTITVKQQQFVTPTNGVCHPVEHTV